MEFSIDGIALLLAMAVDVLFRELPGRWHPVAWMGGWIAMFCRVAPASGKVLPFAAGLAMVGSGSAACAIIGWQIEKLTSDRPLVVAVFLHALVLKQMFSVGGLARAARAVEAALRSGDTATAREQLAFHLVSRDVSMLNESQIAAAAIESVAENTSDSIVAPLFYFAIAGLPGVLVYRFINTCDAMVGYRTERFEWLGKPAARMDDLLNLLPARLTALIILTAGGVIWQRPQAGLSVWLRDRRATASPNAGQPMSAAAGVLGIELEKIGCYRLGSGQRPPSPSDLDRGVRLLWHASAMATVCAVAWLMYRDVV